MRALRCVCLLASILACAPGEEPPLAGPARLSLLAVGDTGAHPEAASLYRRQLAVAAAMTHHDRERPADALVLLGDNFYDHGLVESELAERIAANLVRPYCRFTALTGPRSQEVAAACPLPAPARRGVPIHAVLGNHDHETPESPGLQRRSIPLFVSSWDMPLDGAEVRELRGGVSLILADSHPLFEGEAPDALRRALLESRGPWRILVLHHPLPDVVDTPLREAHDRYRNRLLPTLQSAGLPIHLILSGHEHNLQLVAVPSLSALQVIAGSGSSARPLRGTPERRLAGANAAGYARIDLIDAPTPRLVASLYEVPRFPRSLFTHRKLTARASIDDQGNIRPE